MITLERALEIFSNKEMFKKTGKSRTIDNKKIYDFEVIQFTDWHYTFRVHETTYNEMATIDFGRWTPMLGEMLCWGISNEDFLLHIINEIKSGII